MVMERIKRLPSPFKYVEDHGDGIGASPPLNICEAEFELPNDSTPDTRNCLVVRIAWETDKEQAQVSVLSRTYTNVKREVCISTQSTHIDNLSSLLYGYAQVRTQKVLVVTGR